MTISTERKNYPISVRFPEADLAIIDRVCEIDRWGVVKALHIAAVTVGCRGLSLAS
jgi:hypothetical protein